MRIVFTHKAARQLQPGVNRSGDSFDRTLPVDQGDSALSGRQVEGEAPSGSTSATQSATLRIAVKLGYQRATWLIVALWVIVNAATINYNGPFFDEAIFITAGLRTWEGHGYTDGYLVWFAGSLFWPMLAAVGFKLAGLIGTRLIALAMATIACAAAVRAAQILFGARAGFWTAVIFALSGAFISLARLGVYDLPALMGIAISLWAITELSIRDDRAWLLLAAMAYSLSVLAKYPMAIMVIPLTGVTFALRKRKALMDIVMLSLITAALSLAFFLPTRPQLSQVIAWTTANRPTFGITPQEMIYRIFYYGQIAIPLAVAGWFVARRQRLLLMTSMAGSLVIWPAYAILSGNPVGLEKHMVFGYLLAFPVAGFVLSLLWDQRKGKFVVAAGVVVMAVLCGIQMPQFNRAWPDSRPAAAYLLAQVKPGQKLLINESWPYTMALYAAGRIKSPWDVFDVYRIEHGQSPIDLCQYDWFVDSKGSYDWPDAISSAVQHCGVFQSVYTTTDMVTGMGDALEWETYPVTITIWRNTTSG